jgi:hypothetical protein
VRVHPPDKESRRALPAALDRQVAYAEVLLRRMSDRVAQAVAVEDVADAAALSSDLRTSEAETELGAECASETAPIGAVFLPGSAATMKPGERADQMLESEHL